MQRIERYGVIALVFLLVTILAVAVWGQRKNQSLLSFFKDDKGGELAQIDAPAPGTVPEGASLALSSPTHGVTPTSSGSLLEPTVPGHASLKLDVESPPASAVVFDQGSALNGATQPNQGFLDAQDGLKSPGTPVGPAAPAATARTYKVKSGDTLGSIAQRELGSTKRWKEIEALNGVKPERLAVGMVLQLPTGAAASEPHTLVQGTQRPLVETKAPSDSARTYRVRSGDSLSRIAASQLGDANRYAEILALNPGLQPNKLAVGQSLRMPQSATPPSTTPKSRPRVATATPQVAKLDASPKKAKVQ